MSTTPLHRVAAVLKPVVAVCRSGEAGFRSAAEAIHHDERLRVFLVSCADQRARFVHEWEVLWAQLDLPEPLPRGLPAASHWHRSWLRVKALATGRSPRAVLAGCGRGDEAAARTYDRALAETLPAAAVALIERQRPEVIVIRSALAEAERALTPAARAPLFRPAALASAAKAPVQAVEQAWHEAARATGRNPGAYLPASLGTGFLLALLLRLLVPGPRDTEQWMPGTRRPGTAGGAGDREDPRPRGGGRNPDRHRPGRNRGFAKLPWLLSLAGSAWLWRRLNQPAAPRRVRPVAARPVPAASPSTVVPPWDRPGSINGRS